MDELMEMEKILYVEFEEYGDNFPKIELHSYSVYQSKNCDSSLVLLYNDKICIGEDFQTVNDVIVKELEHKYKKVSGGVVNHHRNSKNDYCLEIEKDACKLSVQSKYVDMFNSLIKKFEDIIASKYDTRAKFGKGSIMYLSNNKCVIDEVNLVKAKDFKEEEEEYKYEYEYTIIDEQGYVRKIREEKLVELAEEA
jgi:hypothetical protein